MTSFIEEVVDDLISKKINISEVIFVLPNKRAGLYLKNQLAQKFNITFIVPRILSVEEFIEDVAEMRTADNVELLFQFYNVYSSCTPSDQVESFEKVTSWANMLLKDFNNIDRYLIPPDKIFDYLSDIKELERWSLTDEPSESISNYLDFWKRLKSYYHALNAHLKTINIGYQGLVYKEAANRIDQFVAKHADSKYIFVGFNALNRAEELIVQKLLLANIALCYWDIDEVFFNSDYHDAGLFIRNYTSSWDYFKQNEINFLSDNYSNSKQINVVATSKDIGQVKYVGQLLKQIRQSHGNLESTAVVLGDENLLLPLLNSLPEDVGPINITMGINLDTTPIASLFEHLFHFHKNQSEDIYHKDLISILSHPSLRSLFTAQEFLEVGDFISFIKENNLIYLKTRDIKENCKLSHELIQLLFAPWKSVDEAVSNCINLIFRLKDSLDRQVKTDVLYLEFLYRFNKLFNKIHILVNKFGTIHNITSLYSVYRQFLKVETLDFQGEPLQGLQIMGMLETRVLDFKNLILLSVNEGILPAGKSESSFIPYDIKREHKMPTYKEMDAVYTYHFYRLLQRAEEVYLIYNTEPDVLNGGEKSRFISQLQFEQIHKLNYISIGPKAPSIFTAPKEIEKSPEILKKLQKLAADGFSPSSLTNYIRNPLDFYYEKILGIKDAEIVEETVASNTLGTIIHNSLEELYLPYLNTVLTKFILNKILLSINNTVSNFFQKEYKKGDITKGKNLIIFEICKKYVSNFILKELKQVEAGDEIIINELEKKFLAEVFIPELDHPVKLRGTVDRIDTCNGTTRIIDFKTGKVNQADVEIVDWQDITSDYKKYSKSFQILCYAYMLNQVEPIEQIEGGIISFKNLKDNYFLKFATKATPYSRTKDQVITSETLNNFEVQLKSLILEIMNPQIPFLEKEV